MTAFSGPDEEPGKSLSIFGPGDPPESDKSSPPSPKRLQKKRTDLALDSCWTWGGGNALCCVPGPEPLEESSQTLGWGELSSVFHFDLCGLLLLLSLSLPHMCVCFICSLRLPVLRVNPANFN